MKFLHLTFFYLQISLFAIGQNSYSGGSGSEENPFQISNLTDLKTLILKQIEK